MASYQGKILPSPFATIIEQNTFDKFHDDWSDRLQLAEVFHLIDSLLPFEVCVYHEVLPLSIETAGEGSGTILHLGMVTPDDAAALDYVQRLASYQKYQIVPHSIVSEALQTVLSNYLKDAGSQQFARHRATEQPDPASPSQVISPETISPETISPETISPETIGHPHPHSLSESTTNVEADDDLELDALPITAIDLADLIIPSAIDAVVTAPNLPQLDLALDEPLPDDLTQLPAESVLRYLLTQILQGGIGRLYFECHAQHGRILWSKDGVVQAALDDLALPLFQGILNALKQLAQLPIHALHEPLQPEVEYRYQKTRLLLRFRFVPSEFGEEATVQVLRGVALKFYQKQQLAQLERDAVSLARQLQRTINELRDRTLNHSGALDALPEVSRVLRAIESQISELA